MTAATDALAGPPARGAAALVAAGTVAAVALVVALTYAGSAGAVVGWLAVQAVAALAVTRILRLPSAWLVAAVVLGTAVAADVVVATRFAAGSQRAGGYDAADGTLVRGLAGVVAVAFLVSLVGQLLVRERTRVTETLAATVGTSVVVATAAGYVALAGRPGGRAAVTAAVLGVGIAAVVGRAVDAALPRPPLAAAAGRGLAGAVGGLVVAAAAGAVYGWGVAALTAAGGFAIATVAAVLAVAVDLGIATGDPAQASADRKAWPAIGVAVAVPLLLSAAPAYVVAQAALG